MKKILLSSLFGFVTLALNAAVEYDLRKGVDLTATNRVSFSLINQMIDNGTISATNKGGVIRQATTPDTGNNTRYTNFIYISNSVVSSPTLMLWNGFGWIPGLVGANTIGSGQLQDSAVTAGKLAGSSVYGTNIIGNTILSTNLADNAVSGIKIAPAGIIPGSYAFRSVTGGDITNKTITYTNIADGTIGSDQLAANAVLTANLTNLAVTAAKILTNTVNRTHLIDSLIGSSQLTNGAAVSNTIAALAIEPIHFSTNLPVVKAWGFIDCNTVTVKSGHNCGTPVNTSGAAGRWTVPFTVAMSSTNYTVSVVALNYGAQGLMATVMTNSTDRVAFRFNNATPTDATPTGFYFQVFE